MEDLSTQQWSNEHVSPMRLHTRCRRIDRVLSHRARSPPSQLAQPTARTTRRGARTAAEARSGGAAPPPERNVPPGRTRMDRPFQPVSRPGCARQQPRRDRNSKLVPSQENADGALDGEGNGGPLAPYNLKMLFLTLCVRFVVQSSSCVSGGFFGDDSSAVGAVASSNSTPSALPSVGVRARSPPARVDHIQTCPPSCRRSRALARGTARSMKASAARSAPAAWSEFGGAELSSSSSSGTSRARHAKTTLMHGHTLERTHGVA